MSSKGSASTCTKFQNAASIFNHSEDNLHIKSSCGVLWNNSNGKFCVTWQPEINRRRRQNPCALALIKRDFGDLYTFLMISL